MQCSRSAKQYESRWIHGLQDPAIGSVIGITYHLGAGPGRDLSWLCKTSRPVPFAGLESMYLHTEHTISCTAPVKNTNPAPRRVSLICSKLGPIIGRQGANSWDVSLWAAPTFVFATLFWGHSPVATSGGTPAAHSWRDGTHRWHIASPAIIPWVVAHSVLAFVPAPANLFWSALGISRMH